MAKIKKGLCLTMKYIMSNKDKYEYRGYISRVFKNKCFYNFVSNNPLATKGYVSWDINVLQKRIDNKDNCIICEGF